MGGDYVLIGWLALDTTQSSSWVGIAFALYYLPNIIFGIIGGGIADRFPRRGLLQGLDFGAAGLIILFSVLFVYQTPQAPLVLVLTWYWVAYELLRTQFDWHLLMTLPDGNKRLEPSRVLVSQAV